MACWNIFLLLLIKTCVHPAHVTGSGDDDDDDDYLIITITHSHLTSGIGEFVTMK
jgi:hypothetical protein